MVLNNKKCLLLYKIIALNLLYYLLWTLVDKLVCFQSCYIAFAVTVLKNKFKKNNFNYNF